MPVHKPEAVHDLAEGVGTQGGDHSIRRVALASRPELASNHLVKGVQPPEISRVGWKRNGILSQRVVRIELLGLERHCPQQHR